MQMYSFVIFMQWSSDWMSPIWSLKVHVLSSWGPCIVLMRSSYCPNEVLVLSSWDPSIVLMRALIVPGTVVLLIHPISAIHLHPLLYTYTVILFVCLFYFYLPSVPETELMVWRLWQTCDFLPWNLSPYLSQRWTASRYSMLILVFYIYSYIIL